MSGPEPHVNVFDVYDVRQADVTPVFTSPHLPVTARFALDTWEGPDRARLTEVRETPSGPRTLPITLARDAGGGWSVTRTREDLSGPETLPLEEGFAREE